MPIVQLAGLDSDGLTLTLSLPSHGLRAWAIATVEVSAWDGFAGTVRGWEVRFEPLREFTSQLQRAWDTVSGVATLDNYWWTARVEFDAHGHAMVTGKIHNPNPERDQLLEYRFETDQTLVAHTLTEAQRAFAELSDPSTVWND